ncbi:MAG: EcsC family protein [Bacteroidota bacterium]
MAKLNSAENKILDEIAVWKAGQPSFLNRATDFVSRPISWVTAKIIPEDIKDSINGVTEKVVEKVQDLSQWTVDPQSIIQETKAFAIVAESISDLKNTSLQNRDNGAQTFSESNTRVGTVSGVGTGLVGWPGLIADLPTLFTLSLRTVHQIALCYGYDVYNEDQGADLKAFEMQYMMQVFKIATASDKVQKQRGLSELKDLEAGRYSEVYGEILGDFSTKQISRGATTFASRLLIKEIIERTITKKAVGLVPGLGAVFNGGFNYVYLKDVGESAYMVYRERFLLDKKGRQRIISVDIE